MSSINLNVDQQQAVNYIDSPLLVLAGAGSGKTGVIINKIASLIDNKVCMADYITAITFTNKAAQEMSERLKAQIPSAAKAITVCTFHRLGLKMLREDGHHLGLRSGFSLIDQRDASVIVAEIIRKDGSMDIKQAENIHGCISRWKNSAIMPGQEKVDFENPVEILASRIYQTYNEYLLACNSVDLDDLILLPLSLLNNHPSVIEKWRYKIRYLLVDEYQDTNVAQYELVKAIAQGSGKLTVVGDDDQSVYTWRGADPRNLSKLKEDFPTLKVIQLQQNYRCSGRILAVANALIANNPRMFDKKLWTSGGYGGYVKVLGANDEEHEADRIVANVMHHNFVHQNTFGDYAILYRSNYQARIIEQKLRELRVPYYISGGLSFFDRSEIRDVLGYIRLLANIDDDSAFLRVANTPRRGIGATSLRGLGMIANKQSCSMSAAVSHMDKDDLHNTRQKASLRGFMNYLDEQRERLVKEKASDVIAQVIEDIDYKLWLESNSSDPKQMQRRMGNVNELLEWIKRMELNSKKGEDYSISDVVTDLMLVTMLENQDDYDEQKNQLALMTMHAAKGLEFNHVTIVGVEEGIMPHQNSIDSESIEEERRLFYVGITRAKHDLVLSYCIKRTRFGDTLEAVKSRFLEELPDQDLEWNTPEDAKKPMDQETAKLRMRQLAAMLDED